MLHTCTDAEHLVVAAKIYVNNQIKRQKNHLPTNTSKVRQVTHIVVLWFWGWGLHGGTISWTNIPSVDVTLNVRLVC